MLLINFKLSTLHPGVVFCLDKGSVSGQEVNFNSILPIIENFRVSAKLQINIIFKITTQVPVSDEEVFDSQVTYVNLFWRKDSFVGGPPAGNEMNQKGIPEIIQVSSGRVPGNFKNFSDLVDTNLFSAALHEQGEIIPQNLVVSSRFPSHQGLY